MNRERTTAPTARCQLHAGAAGGLCGLTVDTHFCQRVREMGLGESACVTKISGTTTIICQVSGTRIALSHAAASHILVEKISPSSPVAG